ncbi:MAG: hypothetical protein ABI175_29780 [Polyangiales bacterium]
MRLVAAALVVLALGSRAGAECAAPRQHPVVLNAGSDGGALVVATVATFTGDNEGEALQPTWTFKTGATKAAPVTTSPAPGLVVYALPKGVTSAELFDGKAARAKVTRGTKMIPPPLEAPALKTIQRTQSALRRGTTNTHTVVTLSGPPPAEAAALVVADDKGTARSFGIIDTGEANVTVYSQVRCSVVPNGTVDSQIGDKITLRYLDKRGRLGAATKPFAITGAPAPK